MNAWQPLAEYAPGDFVSVKRPVRRSWWQWLLRRPVRYVEVLYVCNDGTELALKTRCRQ